jgi:predicted SAM-dependent methyltransferase
MDKKIKVHFGCGYHKLEGWINVDLDMACKPDLVADLRQNLPFKSRSADYIHSEDFVDQLDLKRGYHFFKECHRVLKEGGVMRVLTPDLHQFARRYVRGDKSLLNLWDEQVGVPIKTRSLCELFNLGMRLGGHTFLYDEATLVYVLKECGFEPKGVGYQVSHESELRGMDLRSPQTGISLYYDCYKGEKRPKSDLSLFNLRWLHKMVERMRSFVLG